MTNATERRDLQGSEASDATENPRASREARAPDAPSDLRRRSWFGVLRRTISEFREDNVTDWAAALTYVRLTDHNGGTRMEIHERFESREALERMVDMGTVDGLQQAVGQIDRLLV